MEDEQEINQDAYQVYCPSCESRKQSLIYIEEREGYLLHLICQNCGAYQIFDLVKQQITFKIGEPKK